VISIECLTSQFIGRPLGEENMYLHSSMTLSTCLFYMKIFVVEAMDVVATFHSLGA
jgi:hypothetical protein